MMDRLIGLVSFVVMVVVMAMAVGIGEANTPQPNVISDGKKSGLYIWIYLKDGTDVQSVVRKMAKLQSYVDDLCGPESSCRSSKADNNDQYDDQVLAGVGFGYDFYTQAVNEPRQNYTYVTRKGVQGSMPNTGGDIFIHAKSNSHSKLFELSQTVQKALPPEAVADFRDVYGFVYKENRDLSGFIDGTEFVYKENRDLSGFIDGTENPIPATRVSVALDSETNGSYCLTQEWIHHMGFIASQSASNLESFVGRKLTDSAELQNKSASSHVARMTSGPSYKSKKPVEIYRQSMPYGSLGSDAGLFFIAYASNVNNFEFMLARMTGKSQEESDDIMRMSRCVSGNYWYFPSVEELDRLQQNTMPSRGGDGFRSNRPAASAATTKKTAALEPESLPSTSSGGVASRWLPFGVIALCLLAAFYGLEEVL